MPRVLSVGQCGFDHGTISRQLRNAFRAEVVGADTFAEAVSALKSGRFDLVLVNRVSDADGSLGVELIRQLKADARLARVPVMLVSNYPDAQSRAEALGAVAGFGKSDLGTREALGRIGTILHGPQETIADDPAAVLND